MSFRTHEYVYIYTYVNIMFLPVTFTIKLSSKLVVIRNLTLLIIN